jgi:hypothetical protein
MTEIITSLFERDINKLIEELMLYKNEETIWKIKEGISNSGGNLTLHLLGNLNHFIGATLGNTGYIRERDKEFSLKNVPRRQLVEDLKKVNEIVKDTLMRLSDGDLEKDFPVPLNDKTLSTSFVLLHLLMHLSYHLGQVNYHRRLIS